MEKGISAHQVRLAVGYKDFTAQIQIISYLGSHAHPQMYNSVSSELYIRYTYSHQPPPLLHPTIVDQLHLWDRERNRLQTEDGELSMRSQLTFSDDV